MWAVGGRRGICTTGWPVVFTLAPTRNISMEGRFWFGDRVGSGEFYIGKAITTTQESQYIFYRIEDILKKR